MSSESALERRYQWLLNWYPAEHRRQHGREMIDVLMTGARPGRRRPALVESANLIGGALRIRLRSGLDSSADPGWRDALAVVSVIMPLYFLFFLGGSQIASVLQQPGTGMLPLGFLAEVVGVPLVLSALVLLRMRRTAALVTAVLTIGLSALIVSWWSHDSGSTMLEFAAIIVLAPALETVALLASPGPRRGLQILGWKHRALIAAAGLVVYATAQSTAPESALAVLAVMAIAMTLASALGRRVLVLLAIPFSSFAIAVVPGVTQLPFASGIALTYLPPLAILALVLTAVRRSSRTRIPSR